PAGLVIVSPAPAAGRRSMLNRYLSVILRQRGLGTLVLDLLTRRESVRAAAGSESLYDINRLASRLATSADLVRGGIGMRVLPYAYVAAGSAGAAALVAAAEQPDGVAGVVTVAGRPD